MRWYHVVFATAEISAGSISSAASEASSSSASSSGEQSDQSSHRVIVSTPGVAPSGPDQSDTSASHVQHHEGFAQASAIAAVLKQMTKKPHQHLVEKMDEVVDLQSSVDLALQQLRLQHRTGPASNSEHAAAAVTKVAPGMFDRLGLILARSMDEHTSGSAQEDKAATPESGIAGSGEADTGAYSPPAQAESAPKTALVQQDASLELPGPAAAAAAAAANQVPALQQRLRRLEKKRQQLQAGAAALAADADRLHRVCDAHIADMKRMAEEEAEADKQLQQSVVSIT